MRLSTDHYAGADLRDARPSATDPQVLLAHVLGELRKSLDADTAAVLVLDRSSGWLVATAASGLEAGAYRGWRFPVAEWSFAGRVVTECVPVVVHDVDDSQLRNPILRRQHLCSVVGVPLVRDGAVLGVLHIGSLRRAHFGPDALRLAEAAAERAGPAVEALVSLADREAAIALQHSLNPVGPPQLAGADIAARYVPGAGYVGGDWYDVFRLPDGNVCLVVGDVAGDGLAAAVIMGRMRSALRSYALETSDPADILSRLDRKMQYFEPDAIATVACVVLAADMSHGAVSLAGHLPPLLAAPGQATVMPELPADLLIGARNDVPRRTGAIRLPPGAILCLYSDGLIERRDRIIDDGIAALMTCLAAGTADAACASIMETMLHDGAASDDLTLLAMRRLPVQPLLPRSESTSPGTPAPPLVV